jgi:ABC-type sugar transport system substrate-binding protein
MRTTNTKRLGQSRLMPLIVGLAAIAGAVISGCGEASESLGGSAEGDRAAAEKLVARHTGPVKFISPGDPIDVGGLQGDEIWIIASDMSIPFVRRTVDGFRDAARAAGLKGVGFDGKGQAKEWSRGIDQAIAAGAAGIALSAVDTEFVSGALRRANAADIPVIGMLNTDVGAKLDPGTAGEATNDYTLSGELLAAYATTHTDGPVRALYSDTSEFRILRFLKDGLYDGMRRYCGSECSISTFDSQIANFKTQLPTLTQSQLRRHQDTNWVFPAFDGQAVFVIPAIKQAGFGEKVEAGSINAVPANLDLIKDGDVQAVDVGAPNSWLGWSAVDRLMRAMLDEKPGTSEVPIKLFDRENLEGVDTQNEDELYAGADYRAEYQKLWKR